MMEWISVKDRLPELPDRKWCRRVVICCDVNGHVSPMYWARGIVRGELVERWEYIWYRVYDVGGITHWMPLPEPPENNT